MINNGYNDDKNSTITFSRIDGDASGREKNDSDNVGHEYNEEELAAVLNRRRNANAQKAGQYSDSNGNIVSNTRARTSSSAIPTRNAPHTGNDNSGTQVFNRVQAQNIPSQANARQIPKINPERSVSARLNGQSQSASLKNVTNIPQQHQSRSSAHGVPSNTPTARNVSYGQNVNSSSVQNKAVSSNQSRASSSLNRIAQPETGMQSPRRLTPSSAAPSKNKRSTNASSGRLKRERTLGAKRKKHENNDSVGGTLRSVFKAVGYIVGVIVISVFISIFGISVGNDAFAFVKESNEVQVSIGEYTTISELASALKKSGAIKYPLIFRIYAKLSHMDDANFIAGDYTIKTSLNYDQLLNTFAESTPVRTQVSVTIPEGYTIDEIVKLFVEDYGIGTYDGFQYALEEFEWDYWFVQELDNATLSSERKYKLEGYLFPDTYYYFSDSNEVTVIYKMLENFNSKFGDSMRERCAELGYTVDEIVTLASMIQMEAKYPSEYTDISSVFHNRLNYPSYETQGRLESDPSIMYIIGHSTNLTQEEKEMNSAYNTYVVRGLPPSAISNPSLYAINCALYPNDTDYFYFYALGSGYHVFAKTYAEHTQNILDSNK